MDVSYADLTTGAWNALTDNSAGGVVGITWFVFTEISVYNT